MLDTMRLPVRLLAAALLVALSAIPALAQDPAAVNPNTVTVKLDNPHVRVLDSVLKPGQKEQLHSHPASLIYVIEGGKIRNHTSDGKVTDAELLAGATIYREPLTHWAENIGTTTLHLILVELKDQKQPPPP
jgi:quercetin dioxygenase-like cupin family protein